MLLAAEGRNRLSQADVVRFLALVQGLPIAVEHESPERMLTEIVSLARDLHLSTYEAPYLDLAMRSGLPIATQDRLLMKVAKKCRVTIFDPTSARKKS